MKILVTGASGQLGSELHNLLETKLPGTTTYAYRDTVDLTDQATVDRFVADGQFSHIINCAAYTNVEEAETHPRECRSANVDAVGVLASAAQKADAKIIHISTDYVFDGKTNHPYKESDRVNPLSEYGRSKRQGEILLLDMASEGLIIRTSWLYSPYRKNFVKTMMAKAEAGIPAKVVIDQVGTPTYTADLANAIIKILMSPRWLGGIFNYSNQGVCSWYDIAAEVYKLLGRDPAMVKPITSDNIHMQAQRPLYSVLDKNLIANTYGIEVPYWRESLEHCMKRLLSDKSK